MMEKGVEIVLFDPKANKKNVVGPRLLVLWSKKTAYFMGVQTDPYALAKGAKVTRRANEDWKDFVADEELTLSVIQAADLDIHAELKPDDE